MQPVTFQSCVEFLKNTFCRRDISIKQVVGKSQNLINVVVGIGMSLGLIKIMHGRFFQNNK